MRNPQAKQLMIFEIFFERAFPSRFLRGKSGARMKKRVKSAGVEITQPGGSG
jgi:hypothetical protein